MKKGILFDLDGTLWETTDITLNGINYICDKYNVEHVTKEQVCKCMGLQTEEAANIFFPGLDIDLACKIIDESIVYNADILNEIGGNVYPNVCNTIVDLSNDYDLYIVSNTNNPKYIESFINKANLKEYFKDYIAAAQLKIPKSEAIKKIIKDHNIAKAVYVGDTIKDKESAELANIPFIYAEYGFGDINHDISIKDLSGLKNIISTVL